MEQANQAALFNLLAKQGIDADGDADAFDSGLDGRFRLSKRNSRAPFRVGRPAVVSQRRQSVGRGPLWIKVWAARSPGFSIAAARAGLQTGKVRTGMNS